MSDDNEPDWRIARALDRCDRLFPKRYATAVADLPDVLAWAARYRDTPDDCPSLLLLGRTGVGKTHQAYGAIRAAVSTVRPVDWRATTAADMYADLRPRAGIDSADEFRKISTCPLLLIDDIGAAKHSDWTEEVTYRLINHRYQECVPTIFTSNVTPTQLADVLGDRIASRLTEMCTRVVMPGQDRRRAA
ncbi:ATP-binding protein [Embleya sp. NPDC005971]|uniref:ATP-binding protein n=1 Tax=Embleya sp. NPDC005971 TaxID=3156724 RepID=UPI0033D8869F